MVPFKSSFFSVVRFSRSIFILSLKLHKSSICFHFRLDQRFDLDLREIGHAYPPSRTHDFSNLNDHRSRTFSQERYVANPYSLLSCFKYPRKWRKMHSDLPLFLSICHLRPVSSSVLKIFSSDLVQLLFIKCFFYRVLLEALVHTLLK